jgi:hypothetical protein
MPSITYWSQLFPSPRTADIAETLAARVRDPAWFLARQWQLGEFQGADAGSPAFVRILSRTAPLATAAVGSATETLAANAPLEPLVEREPFTPDLATRVEAGQTFEALLARAGIATTVRDAFRAAYPVSRDATPGATPGATIDAATAAFLRVCAGRATDGVALYEAARAGTQVPALDATMRAKVTPVLAAFTAWVDATWGAFGRTEPPAWDPTRLAYEVKVATSATDGGLALTGTPDGAADFDWYSFDVEGATPAVATPPTATSVLPGHVQFRGMPSPRWWDYEGSKTDFGAVVPDPRDLGKLLFMDFLLLHGADWYLAPLDVATGSLAWIDSLTVTDVFGVASDIPSAQTAGGWSMFVNRSASPGIAPFLLVPATASASIATSAPIEDVHLLRDETADLAWAIEHIVEGATGAAAVEPAPSALDVPRDAPAPLVYVLETPLPASWFPLMPQSIGGAIMLAAGTVEGGAAPRGRIVPRLSAPDFLLPDAEVPRSGVQVRRIVCRARSADGATHLWIARRTRVGAGAAASALRYDLAQPA